MVQIALRLLLDTHALLWWLLGEAALPQAPRDAIADQRNEIFVSAATAWEISIKFSLGKLPTAATLAADFDNVIAREGFQELPISALHGLEAGALRMLHKDPFDRMLVAQARIERLALVSNETVFDACGVRRLW